MKNGIISVRITDRDDMNRSLKKFKRLCDAYGVLREYKGRKAFLKPSIALKEKKQRAEKRRNKAIMKERANKAKI